MRLRLIARGWLRLMARTDSPLVPFASTGCQQCRLRHGARQGVEVQDFTAPGSTGDREAVTGHGLARRNAPDVQREVGKASHAAGLGVEVPEVELPAGAL